MYEEIKEKFLLHVGSYATKATIQYYKINFQIFEIWLMKKYGTLELNIKAWTRSDFMAYLSYLRTLSLSVNSVRTYARAMRVFFRWAYYEGDMNTIITDHVKFPKAHRKIILPLTEKRVKALENAIRSGYDPERNLLIFHLLLDCGLRSGEVVRLNLADLDLKKNYLIVQESKNHHSRVVPLCPDLKNLVEAYIALRSDNLSALILNHRKNERISKNAIQIFFQKLKKVDAEIHAHLCRHTFATSFIMGGGNLEILRVLLGHDSYQVTREYLHIATQMTLVDYDIYKLDKRILKAYTVY